MALKEWAVVVWALGNASQILLLRKGGLAEQEGEFRLAAKEFFFYPTYEHAQTALLQPRFASVFNELKPDESSSREVFLDHYAAVTDTLPAPELSRMKGLRDAFVWNDAFLEKRYSYKPHLPLFILLVKTYHLPSPIRVPIRESYAGCRSWVDLEEELPTRGAIPVLPEKEYERQKEVLLRRIAGDGG